MRGFVHTLSMGGMNDQQSFTVTWLHHHPDLFDCTTAQLSSQEQCQQFCELIGYQPKHKKPDKYYYDAIGVPMLHADYQGKYNANKIFLGLLLFIVRVFDCLIPFIIHSSEGTHHYYTGAGGRGCNEDQPCATKSSVCSEFIGAEVHHPRNDCSGGDLGMYTHAQWPKQC
jgi:hypothetical protein